MNSPPTESRATRAWRRPLLLLCLIVAMAGLAHFFGWADEIPQIRSWILARGAWAPLAFVGIYAAAVVLALPGSLLTLAGGALFGIAYGILLVSIASTLGASLSFLIARYFAREAVARWIGENQQFRRLDQLTRERGPMIVALTRLVPLFPFSLLNYGFGLTAVPFRAYVFWSWLCMLPGTILYVTGADVIASTMRTGRLPWSVIGALVLVGIALAILASRARKRLGTSGANAVTRHD